MAFPNNPATDTFSQIAPTPSLASLKEAFAGYLGSPCQRCEDYTNAIDNFQIRIALLDVQLLKAQKEKADAESFARKLFGLNETAMSRSTATYPIDQGEIELRRSLFQANSERDCLKIMLESAWKQIADLSVLITPKSESKNPVQTDLLQDTEDLLLDLHVPTEPPSPGRSVEDLSSAPKELIKVEDTESISQPADSKKAARSAENAMLESDGLLENSYIFHFVDQHNESNESKDEGDIIIMEENAANYRKSHDAIHEPFCNLVDECGSDGLTVVNSANSSPIASLIELPTIQSIAPKWKLESAPIWRCDIPAVIGESVHAPCNGPMENAELDVKLKDRYKSVIDASTGRIEDPVRLWDSRQELDDAIRYYKQYAGSARNTMPKFFQHGLQFNPLPGSRNVFRTLVISNLSQSATMTKVLDKVRGGVVVDAKLLDTFSITGGKTALVTFLHEQVAKALQIYFEQHPTAIDTRIAQATVLETPTWPISRVLEKALFNGNTTRCLEVSRYPRQISPRNLRRHLRICSVMTLDRVEYMNLRDDGVLALRFESVACAISAHVILTSHTAFGGCKVHFAPDPCAQPLGVLTTDEAGNQDLTDSSDLSQLL